MKSFSFILLFSVFISLVLAGCLTPEDNGVKVTIYKSPTCGCCVGYAGILTGKGYTIETIPTNDMNTIKAQYNIPNTMDSCHTAIIEGYFVEGHVPDVAIQKLLSEKPDIDGIALPDMPAGSPGMPGIQSEDWVIYSLKDGQSSVFMTIPK